MTEASPLGVEGSELQGPDWTRPWSQRYELIA
jgi:hypothetical protein